MTYDSTMCQNPNDKIVLVMIETLKLHIQPQGRGIEKASRESFYVPPVLTLETLHMTETFLIQEMQQWLILPFN